MLPAVMRNSRNYLCLQDPASLVTYLWQWKFSDLCFWKLTALNEQTEIIKAFNLSLFKAVENITFPRKPNLLSFSVII